MKSRFAMEEITTNPLAITILSILGGVALLVLGRKLYWLFVGVIGFFAGVRFGADLVAGQPEWVLLVAAVIVGLVAALLAVFLQRVVIAIAGGYAGGVLAMELAIAFGAATPSVQWIAFGVGAVIAAILVSLVFDWALILISSLLGAVVIAQGLGLGSPLFTVVVLVLAIVGVLAQFALYRRGRATA